MFGCFFGHDWKITESHNMLDKFFTVEKCKRCGKKRAAIEHIFTRERARVVYVEALIKWYGMELQ